jgi:hypothetical protein
LEVPSWFEVLLRRQQQFPLHGGLFRGRDPVSSRGSVNSQG